MDLQSKFAQKKKRIVQSLERSGDSYQDASPKGTVDDGIRELISYINDLQPFVTTSSCAGRVAVYLEGPPKEPLNETPHTEHGETNTTAVSRNAGSNAGSNAGGKGGGKWLFSSHSQVNLDRLSREGALFRLLGFSPGSEVSMPSSGSKSQFVHLKFEPMILHIQTLSLTEAHAAFTAAMQAGFRESGISGTLDNKNRPSNPMVAVRTTGLALDSIIGFKDATGSIRPMVSEPYLRTVLELANERFKLNEQRKSRFTDAFNDHAFQVADPFNGMTAGMLTKKGRKAKKRERSVERRKQELELALDGSACELEGWEIEEEDSFGLDLLTAGGGDPEEPQEQPGNQS